MKYKSLINHLSVELRVPIQLVISKLMKLFVNFLQLLIKHTQEVTSPAFFPSMCRVEDVKLAPGMVL